MDDVEYDIDKERLIKEKLDLFFDKKGERYIDNSIFDEVFDLLDDPVFENKYPSHYKAEIKRVRDLKNSFGNLE